MNDRAIEFQNVTKSFGKKQVLNGTSLQVEHGKTYAFLGRNGAGKTTAINLMVGLLPRENGQVQVLGIDPAEEPIALRQRIGYLAEDQTMYGWMRCDDMLRFMAPFYPTWDHDLALQYALDFEVPLQTRIKNLSKGQNVRLGLVLALAHRPELVILDDPALGLDPIMRKQFNRDLITHLQGEGRTLFYSSHLLYEVEPVADVVAILDEGKIVRQCETEKLRADVKQIVLPFNSTGAITPTAEVLDQRIDGNDWCYTVAGAEALVDRLRRDGVDHRVVDLNLDEIFEAYVTGDKSAPMDSHAPLSVA